MNSSDTLTEELTEVSLEELLDTDYGYHLVVYNDDHNSFDWVIQSFMEVCHHTFEQSEQLSLIIHFKGKATVKTGEFEVLKPMKDALTERGLSAVIESSKKS